MTTDSGRFTQIVQQFKTCKTCVFWISEIFVNLTKSVVVFWVIGDKMCLSLTKKIFRTFFVIQDSTLGVTLVELASDAPAGNFSAIGGPCDRCQAVLWRMRDLEFQGSAIHVPYVDLEFTKLWFIQNYIDNKYSNSQNCFKMKQNETTSWV